MDISYTKIGERIRYIRVQSGLSQEELAEFSELTQVYISKIETGAKKPSLKAIISIANALNTSTDSILADSLTADESAEHADFFQLLSDCTPAENNILIKNMQQLKEILRQYRITS